VVEIKGAELRELEARAGAFSGETLAWIDEEREEREEEERVEVEFEEDANAER
jgi:hypothetical protein